MLSELHPMAGRAREGNWGAEPNSPGTHRPHTTTTSYLTGQLPTGLLAFLPTFGSGVGVYILEGRSGPWPQPFNSHRTSLTNQFNHVISSSVQWPLPLALQSAKQLLFPSGASLHDPSLTGSQGIWASHLAPSL